MYILIVTPQSGTQQSGNWITSRRWAAMLTESDHEVTVTDTYADQPCDVLVVLHARRGHSVAQAFKQRYPDKPLILALTGTDLYRDLPGDKKARESIVLADRLIVLQKKALERITEAGRSKAVVIYQSAETVECMRPRYEQTPFKVTVVAHLRPVKDAMRTALAARLLPQESSIEVVHIGRALTEDAEAAAQREMLDNSRYRWLGEVSHDESRECIARSHLTVISSLMEGSCNVLSEALTCDTPVLASKIDGLVGTLGNNYVGYFEPENTAQLCALLYRAETRVKYYRKLLDGCRQVAYLLLPLTEKATLANLIVSASQSSRQSEQNVDDILQR